MKRFGIFVSIITAGAIAWPLFVAASERNQDLGIGFDAKTSRPNAFIAWRNSRRILEVEVEIKNFGEKQGTGQLFLSIVDQQGRTLASNASDAPQTVTLPAASAKGRTGKIVQVIGNLAMNLLIDKLDRANTPYLLKAWIVTPAGDAQSNNLVVKSFNVPSRVAAGGKFFREYAFENTATRPVTVEWALDTSTLPSHWTATNSFAPGSTLTIKPGELVRGYLSVETPPVSKPNEHLDVRVSARELGTDKTLYAYEWYVVDDATPPEIRNTTHEVKAGALHLTTTVNDGASMLKEASGVRVEYSTDDGATFSSRVMAYSAGNFVGPTSFTADLGPFAEDTKVLARIVASDIAGNNVDKELEPITINSKQAGELAKLAPPSAARMK